MLLGELVKRGLTNFSEQDSFNRDTRISSIEFDSRSVDADALFVCIKGQESDGHDFAQEAVDAGASALCVERRVETVPAVPQFLVPDSREALADLSVVFFDNPSAKMQVVGITGTNGKTTITYLLDEIFKENDMTTGIIGTVETRIGDTRAHSDRTTPESVMIQGLFAEMVESGVDAVAMEISSHAIDLKRVRGVEFAAVAFTNLTQDHLDYHHTMEAYYEVKKRLFTDFKTQARVIDIETQAGKRLAAELSNDYELITVGRGEEATLRVINEERLFGGTKCTFTYGDLHGNLVLPLAGIYNVDNALVAAACALAMGIPFGTIIKALTHAPQVPGRLERIVRGQNFEVVVDYAHTPDSLEKALDALREVTPGRLISVFGCGGDRDPSKRPLMGQIAGEHADYLIATSDNPRTEDAVGILLQVEDGIKKTKTPYVIDVDRRKAIVRACSIARSGDCILISGKGHEDYQIFAHHTIHFDDREVAAEALNDLGFTG